MAQFDRPSLTLTEFAVYNELTVKYRKIVIDVMSKKSLLTTEQMKARFPAQWLLITDYKLDALTSLRKGRVVAHSKDRGEIHRALKQYSGNLCIHFTGTPPQDTVVIFSCLE